MLFTIQNSLFDQAETLSMNFLATCKFPMYYSNF